MKGQKKIVCVIPARLQSSRFPRKILAPLSGKPLLRWAWEGALRVPFFDEVVIAVDSEETALVVKSFGGNWIMTDIRCLTGTERLAEIQKKELLTGDIWVNWQADEPFLSVRLIEDLLQSSENSDIDVWTLKTKIKPEENPQNPNICKVVCDLRGKALYFSRSVIPYSREGGASHVFKHLGLYAYSNEALKKIQTMELCPIEKAESLEQLRFLFNGLKIQVHETEEISMGIDLEEHLIEAEAYVKNRALLGLLIENIPSNRV